MAENNDIKRLNYFTGQFLEAQDFKDEQSYHIGMRRRLNQLLYSPGIVDNGFVVTKTGDKRIKVTAGFAIDASGQELILLAEQQKDVNGFAANATVFVAVRYADTTLEDDKRGTDNITGFIRTTEKPEILLQATPPAGNDVDIALLIAKLQLDGSGNIQAVDTSVRQLANLHFNGNKLGIGTSNPAEKLHISGGKLQLDGNQQISFTDTLASNNLKLQLRSGCGLGVNDSNLYFASNAKHSWRDKDGVNERMSLSVAADGGLTVMGTGNSSFAGNVGVGTTSPQEKLHISGGKLQLDGNQQINFTDTLASTALKLQLRSGCGLGVNDTNLYFMSNAKYSWLDKDGRNERMSLSVAADGGLSVMGTGNSTFAGNVGLGTATPGARLDVNANSSTHGGWLEAIRFSRSEHSAITHPGGGLLFGMHSDRNFYFADIKDKFQKYVMQIEADTGNVGIGTTNPKQRLHVAGEYYGKGHVWLHANEGDGLSGTAFLQARDDTTTSSINLRLRAKSAASVVDCMTLRSDGSTEVHGSLFVAGSLNYFWGPDGKWKNIQNRSGDMAGSFSTNAPSDIRFKTALRPIRNALEKVLQLNGKCYRWGESGLNYFTRHITETFSAGPDATEEGNQKLWDVERQKAFLALSGDKIGLIAQELETVVPEVIDEDEEGYKYIQYQQLIALLVEAIKEQNALIQSLSGKVAALEGR